MCLCTFLTAGNISFLSTIAVDRKRYLLNLNICNIVIIVSPCMLLILNSLFVQLMHTILIKSLKG